MRKISFVSVLLILMVLNPAYRAFSEVRVVEKDEPTEDPAATDSETPPETDIPVVKEVLDIASEVIQAPLKLTEGMLGFDLGKLIITPTKYGKYLKDVTVSAAVVDAEDFKKGDFHDVSEALGRVNSLRIERFGSAGQSATPVIRGMLGSRVLVLIDGVPQNAPSLGESDISKFPLSKVERIEVVRGPFSSLYGASAVGGVVNIITKDVPEKDSVKTSYSFGSWNTHNVQLENGSSLGKVGYNVIVDYLFTDGARMHSDHNAFDVTSKIKWHILDGIDYSFYTNYYLARTEHPGAMPALSIQDRTATQKNTGNENVSSLHDYSSTSRVHLSSVLDIKNFKANHYFIYWDDDNHRETIFWRNNSDWVIDNDDYCTYVYGMEYKYTQPIWDIDTVTLGASFTRKVFKANAHNFNTITHVNTFTGRDDVRREWSLFGENEFKLYPFTVVCGLRYDDPSDYTSRWSPKISGSVDLGFDTKIRASYAKAYRPPTLNDINWLQDDVSEGNPGLIPEKTEAWEIGAEKVFKDILLVRGAFFRQRIHDAIAWAPTGTRVQLFPGYSYARWTPSNLNKLTTQGIELETRFNILKELAVSLDYTYLDQVEVAVLQSSVANDRILLESRRPAAFIPKHKVYGGIEWSNPFNIEGLRFDTFLQFVSHRRNYHAQYGAAAISYPEKILAHYFLWDAKVSYEKDNVEFFVAVDNILDRNYDKFGSTMQDRNYPQDGISFTVGATAKY